MSRTGWSLRPAPVATRPHWLSHSTICHSLRSGLDSPPVPSGSGNLASTGHLRLLPANWLWEAADLLSTEWLLWTWKPACLSSLINLGQASWLALLQTACLREAAWWLYQLPSERAGEAQENHLPRKEPVHRGQYLVRWGQRGALARKITEAADEPKR